MFSRFVNNPHKIFYTCAIVTNGFTVTCAIGGSIYGGYQGFHMSKKDDFLSNSLTTLGGTSLGFLCGTSMGFLWPITIQFFIARAYYRGINKNFFDRIDNNNLS